MAQVTVRFKRVHAAATMPRYAHPGDAGADLHACEPVTIEPGARALVGTGLALELPQGIEAQVRPRSGLALKHGVTVLNAPGTIDTGYRGELRVILINHGAAAFEVVPGMRIAQLVFAPLLRAAIAESDELSASARGEGGFGSTGA